MDILQDLSYRELIYQITDYKKLEEKLKKAPVVLYAGFDPTADSLHIGNLLPILALRRFQLAGHIPIALVGGGTGLIGDPSGKESERTLNPQEIVEQWSERIRSQLAQFLDFETKTNPARLINNYEWLREFKVVEFLRDIGKNFPLGYMLAKESVKSRLEIGISFTEFSYMILQAYDFLVLARDHDCILQVGGSDQWGNITAGIDLIRRVINREAYGLTLPLVTKADNTKFGKTESGTIWLDAQKTSPYQFYQFWINTDDRDVIKFLKYFTFLSSEEIKELEKELEKDPGKRQAQKVLAQEVTSLVHGTNAMNQAKNISDVLFYGGDISKLSQEDMEEVSKNIPSANIQEKEISLVELLIKSKICPSKRQAREDIQKGAIYINGKRNTDINKKISSADLLWEKYLMIRRGKKKYHICIFS